MSLFVILTCLIVLIFALLGGAKILALEPMRELAVHAGFTTAAYRVIGASELAGAVGIALGLLVSWCGALAGVGLVVLLTGAAITHLRNGDGVPKLVPAVVCAALVGGYLVLLAT
ncbi:DoxX family protein [Streptomyces collinus]|uniref:DoxX family protein n=1 Tax=Streptomyces collinus TaxID=42684 RepID=UPI0034007BBB